MNFKVGQRVRMTAEHANFRREMNLPQTPLLPTGTIKTVFETVGGIMYLVALDGGQMAEWSELGMEPINADGLTPEQVAGLNAHSDWILAGKPGETVR